jgi:L-proline amide hydrolase
VSAAAVSTAEGRFRWRDHETWYRVVGDLDRGRPPLIVCHGGPGTPHDYLNAVADVTSLGRACVLYDQIGSNGRSTQHTGAPASMWTIDLFLDELGGLVAHLGAGDAYHVFGHSFGGMLAMEHALRHPPGLRSIVVANAPASIGLWAHEATRLTDGIRAELAARPGAAGAPGGAPDESEVRAMYYRRHVCRLASLPEDVQRAFAARAADPAPYEAMVGASIDHPTGSLADWDIRPRLGGIRTPTLVVSGRDDETGPAVVGPIADGIPGARWVVFEASSHMPHLEERELFVAAVAGFLAEHD